MPALAKQDLFRVGPQRSFTGTQLAQVAFPLGGIGTGTLSLGGRGNLQDWEIYGHPDKGNTLPMTFFAAWARPRGQGRPIARILERRLLPPYHAGHGYPRENLEGVARLDEAVFRGEYPLAKIEFHDRELPVRASLEAFTPFVPLDAEASSFPVAVFQWTFRNPQRVPVELGLLACMTNPIGRGDIGINSDIPEVLNQYRSAGDLHGLWFTAPGLPESDPNHMSAALATTWPDADVQTNLFKGNWFDSAHLLWDDFAEDGRLTEVVRSTYGQALPPPGDPKRAQLVVERKGKRSDAAGALCLRARLKPGERVTLPVLVAWHLRHVKGWSAEAALPTYMSKQFKDAWDAAATWSARQAELETATRTYASTFYGSTLPAVALDAAGSQASIARTCTCLRLANGQFYGWEGCSDKTGCCKGTCTHVWNYEQALAFLFPELERSIRSFEFEHSTGATGKMDFRCAMPADAPRWDHHAAADGQMGAIIRLYRDWQTSGDDAWLQALWPKAKAALEFAWTAPQAWDPNQDGVMEGCQHNTYDIEFYGPNSMMGAMYLGALEAAARMAAHLGETDAAATYRALAAKGRARIEKELWNGSFYRQKVEVLPELTVPEALRGPKDLADLACAADCGCREKPGPAIAGEDFEVKYQYGEGCLSDQLLGQWACHVAGLGYALDPKRVRQTMQSVFRNNFRKPMGAFSNVQRIYALNDEAGLLLCSWPKGERPRLPFVYSDEVWTGIEYQVAAHLIYEGLVAEGLTVAKAVRDRHDGVRRNPWNEFECGHHYARAMSSWSLLTALSGFAYSAAERRIAFAPRVNEKDFRCFFSAGSGWGTYAQKLARKRFSATLELAWGSLELGRIDLVLPGKPKIVRAEAGGQSIPVRLVNGKKIAKILLEYPASVQTGGHIEIEAELA